MNDPIIIQLSNIVKNMRICAIGTKKMADPGTSLESATLNIFTGPRSLNMLHHSACRHCRSCRLLLRDVHDTALGGQEHSRN